MPFRVQNMKKRPITVIIWIPLFIAVALCGGSCSTTALLNLPAASAGFVAGATEPVSWTIQVAFINNTPYRAIFTYGAYDQLDAETIPTNFGQQRLEGLTSTAQISQPCRKTFSVGGDELIRLLNEHQNNSAINITDPRALVRGVYFSSAPANDPLAAEPTEGTAQGMVLLNGVDFSCRRDNIQAASGGGLLVFTFEQDSASPGGFRIDYLFIEP